MSRLTLARWAMAAVATASGASGQVQLSRPGPGFSLKTPAGRRITLSSLRGKVVLLDFWGPS